MVTPYCTVVIGPITRVQILTDIEARTPSVGKDLLIWRLFYRVDRHGASMASYEPRGLAFCSFGAIHHSYESGMFAADIWVSRIPPCTTTAYRRHTR